MLETMFLGGCGVAILIAISAYGEGGAPASAQGGSEAEPVQAIQRDPAPAAPAPFAAAGNPAPVSPPTTLSVGVTPRTDQGRAVA